MSEAGQTPWRTLHPLSIAVNLLPRTWRVIRNFWPLLLAMLYGNRAGGEDLLDLVFVLVFLAMTVGGTVLHFLTLRYRVQDGKLEVRSGLVYRQVRVLAPDRVQNIEMVRNVFHRVAGLVEVKIETASGTEVEGLLSALSEADARELVEALGRARGQASTTDGEPEELPVVVANGPGDLARYGVTSTRLGAALVLFGVIFEGVQRTDPEGLARVWGQLGAGGLVAGLLLVLTGTWIVGTGTALVRHHGFRLMVRDRGLVAEEGLLTRRKVDLPLRKVQVVSIVEPWLRRAVGFGSVHIETAAAREGGGGTQRSEAMIPVVERSTYQRVVQAAIPTLDIELDGAAWRPPHPRALVRSVLRAVVRGAILSAGVSWWFWPWGLLSIALVPIGITTAWLDHRSQGWLMTDEVVVARQGYLSRQTRIVARSKLQALEVTQGLLLRRANLGQLVLRVAGDAVRLPALDWDEALALELALLRPTKRGSPAAPAGVEGESPAID